MLTCPSMPLGKSLSDFLLEKTASTHTPGCSIEQDMGVMCNSWAWLPAPTQKDQVGGHEGVGTVAALGTGADASGLKVGDRVGIKWLAYACGHCAPCLAGADASCTAAKISGYTYFIRSIGVVRLTGIDTTTLAHSNNTPSLRPTMPLLSRTASPATWPHLCFVAVSLYMQP